MKYSTLGLSFIVSCYSLFAQDLEVLRVPIGIKSTPETSEIRLTLSARIQGYNSYVKNNNDKYDRTIGSPKSAIILEYSLNSLIFYDYLLNSYNFVFFYLTF